jgi:hypothetical protein
VQQLAALTKDNLVGLAAVLPDLLSRLSAGSVCRCPVYLSAGSHRREWFAGWRPVCWVEHTAFTSPMTVTVTVTVTWFGLKPSTPHREPNVACHTQ